MVTLSVRSLAVGLVLGASVVVAMGLAQTPSPFGVLRAEYMPHPRDMVQIEEGAPFTVPVGKVFVLTGFGLGVAAPGTACSLKVNGVNELTFMGGLASPPEPALSVMPTATGFTVRAGDTLDVGPTGTGGGGRAWGYLADL